VDREFGGFLTELNRDGSVRNGRKTLVSQSRQIWAFSRMWNAGYRDPRTLQAARDGLEFLRRHFWDEDYEGWYDEVTRTGTVRRDNKNPYGHAFAIYAAVECYRATEDPEALRTAERTFDVLERRAHDDRYGGYFNAMDRRWRIGGRAPESGYKTMNTHLHLLEAFSELAAETGDPLHRKRLREILDLLTEKAFLPQYGCCTEGFNADWTPARHGWFARRNVTTSYGHNVEMAWLIQRAAEVLELPPERYHELGLTLIDHALKYGWDERAGALCSEGPLRGPASARQKVWWVQAENLTALDWAWRTTGEPRYLEALRRQAAWVINRQADAQFGGWWDTIAPDGTVSEPVKAHVWHAAYHEVRGCLNVAADPQD